MKEIAIDIESYSSTDLKKSGVYKYAEADDFDILMVAYRIDEGETEIFCPTVGEAMPENFRSALFDIAVKKTAFNATFERVCINAYYGIEIPAEAWFCTLVQAANLGLPMYLAGVAQALKLKQQKMTEGKALIRYFSVPCKPTKTNGGRTRNLPKHDPEKWELFKKYCVQDVNTEVAIKEKVGKFEQPQFERELYILDQQINDRGIYINPEVAANAVAFSDEYNDRLLAEARDITRLENPKSDTQLKGWLSEKLGEEVLSLTKEELPKLYERIGDEMADADTVRRVLDIRRETGKTSNSKFNKMQDCAMRDGRARGLMQFYGANRTGRWAGRLIQVQNLPGNPMEAEREGSLAEARAEVLNGDLDMFEMFYGNVPDTLSQLIRTAFEAKEGHTFAVADFSAIEARVIAWLAGEQWRLDVFNTHGKIYEASAAAMFGVPLESIGKKSPLRKKGKVAELALGYQGSKGALLQMGALKMGLSEEELPGLVSAWRDANPAIVALWYDAQKCAIRAVETGKITKLKTGEVYFKATKDFLFIKLPSGRKLSYVRPRLGKNQWGHTSLSYEGLNQTNKQWCKVDTYGGKLAENIVQAIARDLLGLAMLRLDERGYDIVMHVHDEEICEVPKHNADETLAEMCEIMAEEVSWAKGLPLNADGYVTKFYLKD